MEAGLALNRSLRLAIAAAAAAVVALAATAPAQAGQSCSGSQIRTASGCTGLGEAGKRVKRIVRETMAAEDLRAAMVRVDVGKRTLVKTSPGESITGVPANLRMQTRIGSIAIPYVIDILFQLRDAGRLSLDDPLSKYFPDIADAGKISLLNLATATSGLPDWIQENPSFVNDLYGNPFQQFTTDEILNIALHRQRLCQPGECFHYAHTNFVHPRQGRQQGHREAAQGPAAEQDPAPTRPPRDLHLGTAGDAAAIPERIHRRPRPIRGLHRVDPVLGNLVQHDDVVDDRRRRQVGEGDGPGNAGLPEVCKGALRAIHREPARSLHIRTATTGSA